MTEGWKVSPIPRFFSRHSSHKKRSFRPKIEGTQATLEEVLAFEANPRKATAKKRDIEEVLNYRISMSLARNELDKRSLCLNLLRDIHRVLLQGVRGQDRNRGEFRTSQNWIGKPGTPLGTGHIHSPGTGYTAVIQRDERKNH